MLTNTASATFIPALALCPEKPGTKQSPTQMRLLWALSVPMLEQLLQKKGIEYQRIPKKEAIELSREWLIRFASNVKAKTGKFSSGRFKWESYWANLEPSISGLEADHAYRSSAIEEYFVIDESGKEAYCCISAEWPHFLDDCVDLYVVPKSMTWSMAFTHERTCHYAISST